MKSVAVLSGKGGVGKTFVAVNLAYAAKAAVYIDCDVEEPNGHLFFKPLNYYCEEVSVTIPEIAGDLCTGCRACVDFCQYNALAYAGNKIMVFDELCHYCGGCTLVCPVAAIHESSRTIGTLTRGSGNRVMVCSGTLNIGEANGIPIIKRLKRFSGLWDTTIIDCPPGSSCAVMESINDCDFCLLVTEPTTFGIHNMALVRELAELLGKPYAVLINKALPDEPIVREYCAQNNIPVIGEIPYSAELADLNSRGKIAALCNSEYQTLFAGLLQSICGGDA